VTVNPVPTITLTRNPVDGPTLNFTPANAHPESNLYGLDDFSVVWGRRHFTEHADAATAKFRLHITNTFGPTMIGQPVTMSWTEPVSGTTRTFFRGRVATQDVTARPRDRHGATRGVFIDLTATGQLAELGNRLTATETWPEESWTARMNRIIAVAGSAVAGVDWRSYFAGATTSAKSVDGTDALTLLQAMYDSMGGDRMVYDPHTNRVGFVRRRAVPAPAAGTDAAFARLRNDPAQYSGGVHVSANSFTNAATRWPMIDAKWVEGGDKVSRALGSRVTRVVKHWTETGGVAKSSVILDPGQEADRGVVAADIQTEFSTSSFADQCGSDWWEILNQEGATFTPEPMTYRADKAGGFDTLALALVLLSGTELTDKTGGSGTEPSQGGANMMWFAGSPWSALGILPCFGVIGGTIRYRQDRGWAVGMNTTRNYWQGNWGPSLAIKDLRANPARDSFLLKDLAHTVTWADLRNVQSW
jgi:hypothetical protein